ncbi:MAG: aminoglycoside 6-adenylyltransferase, partial [Methanobacteriota archaeon]
FERPNMVFMIFSDGTEAELWFASPSRLKHVHSGPFHTLVDKAGILAAAEFPPSGADSAGQTETLRRLITWFWHDMSHFITAIGRGQMWWARGQLDVLRGVCVNLARLRHDFWDEGVGEEPYFKLEDAVPTANVSALQATFCTMERGPILGSARLILTFYKQLATPLAKAHGIPYPADLERVMTRRLENVAAARG